MADPVRSSGGDTGRETTLADRLRDLQLTATVAQLAQVATGAQPLAASLERVMTLALSAVPAAGGAGVTMIEPRLPPTAVASDDLVRRLQEAATGLGEAPWATAASEVVTVASGDLGADRRWTRFGPRARSLGVHSVVAVPLAFDGEVVGSLTVVARGRDVFDAHAAATAETFAVPAAVTVFNARRLAQAERLAAQLQTALTSRAVIDQAIGIVMSRQGGTADDAFERLRQLSQHRNTKLQALAQGIVDDAVSRARARHAGGR